MNFIESVHATKTYSLFPTIKKNARALPVHEMLFRQINRTHEASKGTPKRQPTRLFCSERMAQYTAFLAGHPIYRQEPTRADKSRQEPTRGIFMHFLIKILLTRPYVCVIYPN